MSFTNLVILAITTLTNDQPGANVFHRFGDAIVGVRNVVTIFNDISIGYVEGTNQYEVVHAQKILSIKTNWIDLPMVTGVQTPMQSPQQLLTKPNNLPKVKRTNAPAVKPLVEDEE